MENYEFIAKLMNLYEQALRWDRAFTSVDRFKGDHCVMMAGLAFIRTNQWALSPGYAWDTAMWEVGCGNLVTTLVGHARVLQQPLAYHSNAIISLPIWDFTVATDSCMCLHSPTR